MPEQLDHSYLSAGNVNWYSHSGKQQLLKNLYMPSPYNTTIALLGTYPREMKTYIDTKSLYRNFIEALFVVVQN